MEAQIPTPESEPLSEAELEQLESSTIGDFLEAARRCYAVDAASDSSSDFLSDAYETLLKLVSPDALAIPLNQMQIQSIQFTLEDHSLEMRNKKRENGTLALLQIATYLNSLRQQNPIQRIQQQAKASIDDMNA
jgi:hypothetical protein